jgi:hypothetical protein
MEKILSILMVFTMAITIFPVGVINVSAETSGIFTYSVQDGEATITDCIKTASGAITIPYELGGSKVTCIDNYAFSDCIYITSITIPTNIKSIGWSAFDSCTSLNTVNFNAVNCTFMGISGYEVFKGCSAISSKVIIGDGVTNIPECAFSEFAGLTSVIIANSVTNIDNYAFLDDSALSSITIPASVKRIGWSAFDSCTGLNTVNFNAVNCTFMGIPGNEVFKGCCAISSKVIIGDGVTNIPECAFSEFTGLTSVIIANSVTNIDNYAFLGDSKLTSITIPASVKSIGWSAFDSCTGLNTVNFNAVNCTFMGIPGNEVFKGCCAISSKVIIGDGVTNIPECAFSEYTGLTSVIIANSVTNIDNYAFLDDSKLTSLTVPDNVSVIGDWAFKNCTELYAIAISDKVSSIAEGVFDGCTNAIIYCKEGSYAQEYAIENDIPFSFGTPPAVARVEGINAIIDIQHAFIYGLSEALTSLNGRIQTTGLATLQVIPSEGVTYGTGTIVNVNVNGHMFESYTIVIYGDINGDGNIDSIDAGEIVDYQNYMITWNPLTDAAKIKAADLNGDGNIDSIDAGIAVDSQNYMLTIDQTTGLAVTN